MEAAHRGAMRAGGKPIGFNIDLPFEQGLDLSVSRELSFEFHSFFMPKMWFLNLAEALVIFPGGFGTRHELMELLTLVQTGKLQRRMPIVVYGTAYW